jgi:hypothetical protein
MPNEVHQSTGEVLPMNANEEAAKSIDDWAERKGPAPKKGHVTPRAIKKHAAEAAEMMRTSNWSNAKACHVVALYKWCHTKVYGVEAAELTNGFEYMQACAGAARLIKKEFSENTTACIAFVRWTFQREAWKEKKRREEGDESRGFRVGWKYQFGARLLTDYRIDCARRKGI